MNQVEDMHLLHNYDTIAVPVREGLIMINIKQIVYCESDGGYTNLILRPKEQRLVTRSLNEFEEQLSSLGFLRIHKSYLINIRHLKKYLRGDGGQVLLSTGQYLNVGRSFKKKFLQKVAHFQ